jgi:hypothetical protein
LKSNGDEGNVIGRFLSKLLFFQRTVGLFEAATRRSLSLGLKSWDGAKRQSTVLNEVPDLLSLP